MFKFRKFLEIFFANWTWIFSTFVLILSLDYEECVFLTFRRWIEPRFPKKAELSKYHNIGRISAFSNVNMITQRFHAENCAIEWNPFWNIPTLNKRSIVSGPAVWHIYAKRRNRNGHLKYVHKIKPRSCCLSAIMLCSIYFELFYVEQY